MWRAGALARIRARDVRLVHVDLRLAVDHQLGHRLARARALLDPDRRRRPQPANLGRLAEQRHPVVGHRQHAVDRVLHADALVADDLGHQLERDLHLRVEVLLGERQLGRRQRRLLDRRNLVGVQRDRAVRVGADLETGALLALVHVGVHVADDRVLDHRLSSPRTAAPGRCRSSGGPSVSAGSTRRPSARGAGSTRRTRSRPARPRCPRGSSARA